MRKPKVEKPRSAAGAFSLSRVLPRLQSPLSAARNSMPRPHPVVGKPGAPIAGAIARRPAPPPVAAAEEPQAFAVPDALRCNRCGHAEDVHPVKYVCDKYPHPDPLQICGCESEHLEEVCGTCGHNARSHKPRHRCKASDCHCWGFDAEAGSG